jgi:undecaprenyl-diphosphatase
LHPDLKAETTVHVRRVFPALTLALLACVLCASSAPPKEPAPSAAQGHPGSNFHPKHAVILGVIEGLTEFLPVSSTGHLIIAKDLLGLDSHRPLFDAMDEPIFFRHATPYQPSQLLTMNLATDTFIVFIQLGAVLAVALVCWPQLVSMLMGLLGRDPAGRRLLINVMIAFFPAAFVGYTIHDWIDENLFSIGTIIFAQVAGAALMFYTEAWYGRRYLQGIRPTREELSPLAAAGIGVLQCFAIVPGTSRPMMAIVGGYFAGLDPRRSAEFSFLLGFVTLSAASIFKTYKSGGAMLQVFGWSNVILGAVVAMIVAAVCVRYFAQLLLRHGLNVFAWYRLALAGALFLHYYD